ncbi:hypothetical protein Golomagni_01360 [Golovinomyces magnicellulatus]|nr:hypothetical protein Golomagni_01360 [Golovinomyces magnicellulatus]
MANNSLSSIREEASVDNNSGEHSGNLQHLTASHSSKPLQINIEEHTKECDNILHPADISLDHMYRTNNIECTSHPTIKFDGRGHLYYSNRIVFPVLFMLLFAGFGTVILVYTFTLERALPKKLIMAASISLVLILALWGTCRIFEYCILRKRMGRWHDTPEAENEIFSSGQKCLNHWKRGAYQEVQ